jgi:hypothetical protein
MNSPVEELSPPPSPSGNTGAISQLVAQEADYGQDEERLVERARSEALLRLARAL